MSWFKEEALRLLREKWPNATMLAEELYVILRSDNDTTVTSQTTFGDGNQDHPLTVTFPPGGDGNGNGGNFTIQNTDGCKVVFTFAADCTPLANGQPYIGAGGSGGVGSLGNLVAAGLCKVISGTGTTYTVQIVGSSPPVNVTATVPGIDPGETVPPFSQTGQDYPLYETATNVYVFLVPLWT